MNHKPIHAFVDAELQRPQPSIQAFEKHKHSVELAVSRKMAVANAGAERSALDLRNVGADMAHRAVDLTDRMDALVQAAASGEPLTDEQVADYVRLVRDAEAVEASLIVHAGRMDVLADRMERPLDHLEAIYSKYPALSDRRGLGIDVDGA